MPQELPSPPGPPPDSRWRRLAPWIGLGLALCWTVAVRIPLILNAEVHLDSDLAVDGLTLLEAVQGRWRWHYPGTPYMGIGPVFLSWIQGRIWGVTPITLVSGGTVAHLLIVAGHVRPRLARVRARGRGLEPDPADLRLDGSLVDVGADHRRPPADRGLERGGVAALARSLVRRRVGSA